METAMDQEDGMFADENDEIPVDYEIDDDATDSFSDDEENIFLPDSEEGDEEMVSDQPKTGWNDQVKMIHLRRYIDQLADKVETQNYEVQKYREELKKCREQIEELQRERDSVGDEMEQAEEQSNTAALYRLKANYNRLGQELEAEVVLETKITESLDKAEYALARAQVEQGKLLLTEDDLRQREERLETERAHNANLRSDKETKYAQQALRNRRQQQRDQMSAVARQQARHNHQIEEAIKSQERANKYLEKTLSKIRNREAEEEERRKEHMENRMSSMLKLKKDITNNRENLRALQARDRAMRRQREAGDEKSRQAIEDAGGNPSEEMIKQTKLEEFEKEKQLFALKQRERQIDIAGKILQEEEIMKKRRLQQPHLFTNARKESQKNVKPHRKRKVKILSNDADRKLDTENYDVDLSKFEGRTGDESDSDDGSMSPSGLTRTNNVSQPGQVSDGPTLAKPEFEGMWENHKPYKVPKDIDSGPKLPGASKMDKEIMKKVLDRHRSGIVTKQVAGGKEFTGQPFYSKPDVIHFKDFEVGRTYKKKVILTNVSYSVNYCKLTGLTEHLKDFIDLHFDPPGQMSAGLTCELLVTFKPMINEDLSGAVSFLAQTGPFSIPLVCTTKKCDLHVDKTTLEFGTSVIGETLRRTFTLSNNGALGTRYELYKLTGPRLRTETSTLTSLGRLTTTETNIAAVSQTTEPTNQKEAPNNDKQEAPAEGSTEPAQEDAGKEAADGQEKGEVDQGEIEKTQAFAFSDDADGLLERMDDLYALDGMIVGAVTSGEIGPFSSVKLEVVWQPTIPGKVNTDFCVTFDDPDSERICVSAVAKAIDVPVWVERQTIDLKICMFDRLYQDTIVVNNRATTALRLKFEVCKELRNHLELLPKTGYIQAQSTFSAQLKFLPRPSLFEEASKYFDKETGVLEAPMIITVADQTRPVPFSVHAVVTNSDLEFSGPDIDFGCCTIHEAVTKTVTLTNHSILPQQFGFLGIPEFVDVQPNDGFGTLLPLETIELDIIFQPSKAKEYNFELTCKSLINREFKLTCCGVGVLPPLELSHQVIHMAATAIDDITTASLHVVNAHTSTNEYTHPVPRIGKGDIAPVCPTSFEFVVPEDAPISVSPTVGTVEPGKKCHIHVRFSPKLDDTSIRKEAVRMVTKALEQRAQEEYKAALEKEKELQEQQAQGKGPRKGANSGGAKGKNSPVKGKSKIGQDSNSSVTAKGPAPIKAPSEDKFTVDSSEYSAARTSLLRQYRARFQSFVIPCFVASGKCGNPGELQYSPHNTLYLEVHCPAVRPELAVISDNGRTTVDFGDVSIGQSVLRSVTVQNISDGTLDLRASCLDTAGPFTMLNALRVLGPEVSHTMILCYAPMRGATKAECNVFQETLDVLCPSSTLHLTLKGRGVSPMVNLSIKDGEMDLGAVISGEYREETFKIVNTSTLSVQYSIKLDSQSLLRNAAAQDLPHFIRRTHARHKSLVGTQNNSGQQVFDCVPAEGSITAGGTKEITVTFAPDHDSVHYSDGVRIELFGQEEQHVFRLTGQARPHIMYLEGGDELLPEVESLAVVPIEEPDEDAKPVPISLLVTLYSVSKDTGFTMATREVTVGCVRTMAVSQKKGGRQNGEWAFDTLQQIQAQGFNLEPAKGMIEAATTRPITVTWTPPAGYDPNVPIEAAVLCTVKGDVTETYRVMLRGIVTSE